MSSPPIAKTTPPPRSQPSGLPPGQGFRALTERWTRDRVERVIALLHAGDRAALEAYLDAEVPRVPHATDPPDQLDLKGFRFDQLGYRADLGQVRLEGLNFWSSRFHDVNLKGAHFTRCLVGLASFESVYLRDVTFTDCDLYGCDFRDSNLQRVRFERTALRFSTFMDCEIDIDSFAAGLHEETLGRWALARDIYKALRLNLNAGGDERGSSWAIYQESVMNRRDHWARGRYGAWAGSLVRDLLWGYGQRPGRLFVVSLAYLTAFAAGYFVFGIKSEACVTGFAAPAKLAHFLDCLYFSFVTFTTVGYGDFVPCSLPSRALAATEAFSGIFIMSLFVTANVRKLEGR
jgi:hypothetical protein